MKTKLNVIPLVALLVFVSACKDTDKKSEPSVAAKGAQTIKAKMIHARAVEAAIWGMPAVNYRLMYNEFAKLGGKPNEILYWPGLLTWKNQTLTPNPDVIYIMPFFNTKDVGPVVLEIPPADSGALNGSVMNSWQAAIEDIGPGGVDKGKGGKYLFLPPNYDMSKVPSGYIPLASNTYQGYALIRAILASGSAEDVAKSVRYAQRIKVYPLSAATAPPETKFVDASSVIVDAAIPYNESFFIVLNEMIQAEPWLERDKAMIDIVKTLGIQRGKPFSADLEMMEIFPGALLEAKAWLEEQYESMPSFYEGTHWFFPATEETHQSIIHDFNVPDSYPTDNRGMIYMMAFFSAKHIGESQYYLMTTKDKDGQPLYGKSSYRLHVPSGVPVKQYWSMTVYNRSTHTFLRDMKWMGKSSQTPGLQVNSDGSVDLYFDALPPKSGQSNWIPIDPSGCFEVLARFYGPTKELYTKSWKMGDIEEIK
jgi:hypothetical protein